PLRRCSVIPATSQGAIMPSTTKRKTNHQEAIAMLMKDHAKVRKLFKEFEKLGEDDADRKEEIVREVCMALTVHAQLEEECFYPAVKDEIKEPELVAEAAVEHDVAKQLIAQLESGELDDEQRDATFKVLGEYVGHHIDEEEKELFKQVESALDTSAI